MFSNYLRSTFFLNRSGLGGAPSDIKPPHSLHREGAAKEVDEGSEYTAERGNTTRISSLVYFIFTVNSFSSYCAEAMKAHRTRPSCESAGLLVVFVKFLLSPESVPFRCAFCFRLDHFVQRFLDQRHLALELPDVPRLLLLLLLRPERLSAPDGPSGQVHPRVLHRLRRHPASCRDSSHLTRLRNSGRGKTPDLSRPGPRVCHLSVPVVVFPGPCFATFLPIKPLSVAEVALVVDDVLPR